MGEVAAFGGASFSTRVDLWLELGDARIPLSHVAPGFVIPQPPRDLPPGEGVVVVSIDGRAYRTPVTLDYGMSAADTELQIRPHDSIPF